MWATMRGQTRAAEKDPHLREAVDMPLVDELVVWWVDAALMDTQQILI